MKSEFKKFVEWKPDSRLVAFGFAVMLILLLVPLFRIAIYSTPWYDDYMYGKFVKNFLAQEYSLKSALDGAIYCAKTEWYAWQGTFSSAILMSMSPFAWSEELYFLGPVFLITILPVSVCVLMKVLVRDVLKADRAFAVTLQCITAAMVVVLIHTPQQGFFWYNGGVHYVGMHSFLLLLVAACIKLLSGAGKVSSIFLVLWTLVGAVLAGGGNYVTTLQGLLLVLSLVALGILLRIRRTILLTPSLVIYAYVFYKNVSAPGNSVRSGFFRASGLGMKPLPAVLHSFTEAFNCLGRFTGWMTLAIMVLLVPVIWQGVQKLNFRYRYPGLLLLWSFCLYATGFTPSLYSMGHGGLGRTLNAVKITYQLLLIINEVYWIGWICEKRKKSGKSVAAEGAPFLFYPAMGLIMLGIFAVTPDKEGSYSSYTAYHYVHTGEADNYYREYLKRVDTIKNGGSEVVVEPYYFRPWILCAGDLGEDPANEANAAIANWYNKVAVSCQLPDAGE